MISVDRIRERVQSLLPEQTPGLFIEVPADLNSVTTIGEETPGDVGTEQIWEGVRDWYRAGVNPAIQLCLRRNGTIVLNRSIGYARGNIPAVEPHIDSDAAVVTPDTPFCVYSAAKGITTTVMHMLIERGVFALDTRVCELIPDFTSHGKDRITIAHVLTHSAGMPFFSGGAANLDRVQDAEFARAALCRAKPTYRPGLMSAYHALTFGFLTREIVLAATGRSIRDVLAENILDPLGFRWTNYGVAPEDVALVAPSYPSARDVPEPVATMFRKAIGGTLFDTIATTNDPRFLTAVIPSSNTVSTAVELSRFYELLCNGGELDGHRVISPDTLRRAITPATLLRPDISQGLAPMRWGQGFMLGGTRFGPFGRNAPEAFGHTGLVTVIGWADPARGLSGALVTSGKPGPHPQARKFGELMSLIAAKTPVLPKSERRFVR